MARPCEGCGKKVKLRTIKSNGLGRKFCRRCCQIARELRRAQLRHGVTERG